MRIKSKKDEVVGSFVKKKRLIVLFYILFELTKQIIQGFYDYFIATMVLDQICRTIATIAISWIQ